MIRSYSALLSCLLAAVATTRASAQSRATYTVVHSMVIQGEEFISVVVRPAISDSQLMTAAIELHRLHPRSAITFYDSMNAQRIKVYSACFVKMMEKLDSPSCNDAVFEWNSVHSIADVLSSYNDKSHTGKPTWKLERALRIIGNLGIDDRPPEKLTPKAAPQRLQVGQTGILHWGDAVIMAFTAQDYSLFTKCLDGRNSVDCAARLFNAKKVLHVPNGTKAQVLEFRDNPLNASVLKGQLVQCRILDGTFKGVSLWTLEDRLTPR